MSKIFQKLNHFQKIDSKKIDQRIESTSAARMTSFTLKKTPNFHNLAITQMFLELLENIYVVCQTRERREI